MTKHERFSIKTLEELKSKVTEMGLSLPLCEDMSILLKPLQLGDKVIHNRMAVQPMEGCDANEDGSPSELVFRRYERFTRGGAGLLWAEATAVTQDGRANPRQLFISRDNLDGFKRLVEKIKEFSSIAAGLPYTVIQLTHSGRYSRPAGKAEPIVAVSNPWLDVEGTEYRIITDSELEKLEDEFVKAAVLAREAGFDAVDIKACHRYLNSELLSAFTREGKYGGSFENRTRFLTNIVDKIR